MKKSKIITLFSIAITLLILTSCVFKPHPNQKIIVGTWIPLKVERVSAAAVTKDAPATQAAPGTPVNTEAKQSKTGAPAGDGGASRKEAALDRLIQSEMKSTLEINANKTAVKKFPGKPINATWKLKGKGTRIVAKNIENNMKFVIEIVEMTNDVIVVIEHAPVGDVKITYKRQM
jgi:hypothetical protein